VIQACFAVMTLIIIQIMLSFGAVVTLPPYVFHPHYVLYCQMFMPSVVGCVYFMSSGFLPLFCPISDLSSSILFNLFL
jgi:hypothetical protein